MHNNKGTKRIRTQTIVKVIIDLKQRIKNSHNCRGNSILKFASN
jgi:hypothetical protein